MKYLKIVLILLTATSCQYFETDKISKEIFYQEELKTINWKDVDQYPAFLECENFTKKTEQKSCFENTLSSHLRQTFTNHKAISVRDLNDTVTVKFTISNTGQLSIMEMKITETVKAEFPLLHKWLEESIDTLRPVAPAYKRGIPVATQFTLPIIINTH
jgi:hypothetical protein